MKKHLLMKTLLVALVCLVGGTSSVWGADTFLTTWTGQVGTATNSGNFKYATKKVKIAAGETYVYTLTNFNDGNNSNYWKNWVVEGNLGEKYFDCEARGNQWQAGSGPVPSYTPVMAYTDVENFQTAYNGANVTITISRNAAGNQFTVTHTSNVHGTTAGNTEKYYGGTWTVAVGAEEEWDIYITEEEAHFVVTSVTYTDAGSNVTNYTPLYERGYTTAWSTGDIGEGNWTGSTFYATTSAGWLKIFNQDSNHETSGTLSNASQGITNSSITAPAANSILTYDIIWDNGGTVGHNDNFQYLYIGDNIKFKAYAQAQKGEVIIGSNTINIPNACSNSNGNRQNDVWTIHMVVNTATNMVTELTILGNSGTTKVNYTLDAAQSTGSATLTSLSLGWNRGNYRPASSTTLKSIIISEETPEIDYANYTVHFVDGNSATVKPDEVRVGEVGTIVNASSGDMADYYGGGNKYTYNNDGGGVVVVAGGTAELTVVYDKHEGFTATASAVCGGSPLQADIASVSGYEGETKTLQLNKCIKVGGTWYSTATCYVDVTAAGDNEVTYTATAVKYFYEFESLSGGRTDETDKSYSGGVRSRVNKSNALSTPEEIAGGVYTLTIPYSNGNSTAGKLYLYTVKGGVETDTELTIDCPSGNGTVTKTVTIPDGAALRFKNTDDTYNDNGRIDYLVLTPKVPVEVTAAGFATYVNSDYDLDFSATEIEAYKVKVTSKGVATLTKVNNVPAGTPVLLYKDGGKTENIPVMTGAAAVTENDLVAGTGAAVATTVGEYTNMILNNVSGIGFYFANGKTVATNRAYLHFATSLAPDPAAARMTMIFEDEDVTGVNEVRSQKEDVRSEWFDLQGRKVAQPQKGLYIVNGKKVVLK